MMFRSTMTVSIDVQSCVPCLASGVCVLFHFFRLIAAKKIKASIWEKKLVSGFKCQKPVVGRGWSVLRVVVLWWSCFCSWQFRCNEEEKHRAVRWLIFRNSWPSYKLFLAINLLYTFWAVVRSIRWTRQIFHFTITRLVNRPTNKPTGRCCFFSIFSGLCLFINSFVGDRRRIFSIIFLSTAATPLCKPRVRIQLCLSFFSSVQHQIC